MSLCSFINQRTDWRWTYRLLIIMTFVQLIALWVVRLLSNHEVTANVTHSDLCMNQVVPETYEPVLLKRKAARYVERRLRQLSPACSLSRQAA